MTPIIYLVIKIFTKIDFIQPNFKAEKQDYANLGQFLACAINYKFRINKLTHQKKTL